MKKDLLQTIKIVILGFIVSVGISFAASWTSPVANYPSGNKSAPINVSSTPQGIGGSSIGSLLHISGTLSSGKTSTPILSDALAVFGDAAIAGDLDVNNLVGTGTRPICADTNGNLIPC